MPESEFSNVDRDVQEKNNLTEQNEVNVLKNALAFFSGSSPKYSSTPEMCFFAAVMSLSTCWS